jgi:hypothetical protein
MRVGNKINSAMNGEWCKHARPSGKKFTARLRRAEDKKVVLTGLQESKCECGKYYNFQCGCD